MKLKEIQSVPDLKTDFLAAFVTKWFNTYIELSVPQDQRLIRQVNDEEGPDPVVILVTKYAEEFLEDFKGYDLEDFFEAWEIGIKNSQRDRFDKRYLFQFIKASIDTLTTKRRESNEQHEIKLLPVAPYCEEDYHRQMNQIIQEIKPGPIYEQAIRSHTYRDLAVWIWDRMNEQQQQKAVEFVRKLQIEKLNTEQQGDFGTYEENEHLSPEGLRHRFDRINKTKRRRRTFISFEGTFRYYLINKETEHYVPH